MSSPVVDVTTPEPIASAEVTVPERHVEYGLQLPNGTVQWATALSGIPINTETDRSRLAGVLRQTGIQCGWDENSFLAHYRWVPRTVIQEKGVSFELDEPTIAPPLPESNGDAPAPA